MCKCKNCNDFPIGCESPICINSKLNMTFEPST